MNSNKSNTLESSGNNESKKEEIRQTFQADVNSHFNNNGKQKSSNNSKNGSPVKSKIKETPLKSYFRFIDLFAGIGGIRLAFAPYGKCVFSSEWDKNSQRTYIANFNERPHGDIRHFPEKDIPEHDILLAGFPCQAFSVAGYRKGFKDTRGTLFFEIERILEYHKPEAFLLENVKGLVNHDGGETLKTIKEILDDKLDYEIYDEVLDSTNYANVPQTRERIFIVGFNRKKVKNYRDFNFPEKIPLTKTIHDFLETDKKPDKYYYPSTHRYYKQLNEAITKRDTIYQWRRKYVRENKSNACPTLTANMGTGGHNVPIIRDDFGIRKLTPRECARFQGFPDSHIFPNELADSKKYYQVGNSVTVTLIKRIAENMMEVLQNESANKTIVKRTKKQSADAISSYSVAG